MAIKASEESNFVHEQGLCYELAGKHCDIINGKTQKPPSSVRSADLGLTQDTTGGECLVCLELKVTT